MTFVVSGVVDDWTTAVKDALRQKVATEVGVSTSKVTLTVEAASVRLAFTILTMDPTGAVSTLSTALGNGASDASTFLSTSSLSVTVEAIEVDPSKQAAPEPDGMPGYVWAFVGLGVAILLLLLLITKKVVCGPKVDRTPPGARGTTASSASSASASVVAARAVPPSGYYPDPKVPVGIPIA